MRVLGVLAALAVAFAGVSAMAAPLAAYGSLPSIEAVAVSPSGHAVAVIVTNGEDRVIAVRDNASGKLVLRAATGDAKVRYVRWAGDNHLIIVTTVTGSPMDVITTQREWALAFRMDVRTGKVLPLLRDVGEALNSIAGEPEVRIFNGEPTVFVKGVKFVNNSGRTALFRVDLDRAKTQLVEIGESNTIDFLVGPDGQPIAQELYDERTGRWALKLKVKGGWREARVSEGTIDPPTMIGLGRDGASALYTSRDEKGQATWDEVRAGDESSPPPLVVSDGHSPIHDPQTGHFIGHYALIGDEGRYTFFAPNDTKVWKAVKAAFPNAFVQLESWSVDRRRIVVRVDSLEEGPAYALVDLDKRNATWLGGEYQQVAAADVSPQKPIRFKAADGLELTGYLTTTRGREAKRLPLIVFPHGGPAARDYPGFDWWAQGMASRGYAVLQVNFRGSEGLGDALLEAGYGQWGRKMQTDLSDGVQFLAADGVIDPKRVCIVGASYGGYAALAGAASDIPTYRCAASFGGLSDLGRFVSWSKAKRGQDAFRYWTRFMGAEENRAAVLAQISPASRVDKIAIPVLLIHGKDDSVVPVEQSQILADALKKAGKPYELIVQKGEDHWLSRGETRLQTLTSIMAFVEKHNRTAQMKCH